MNGIFAIEKPSGITSNQFMLKLQHALTKSQVFSKEIQRATAERKQQYEKQTGKKASKRKLRKVSKVKMGHGGTLDRSSQTHTMENANVNEGSHNDEDDDDEEEEEETEEQINARLTKLVNAAPVMLFMKGSPSEPKCGFSRQLVGILREHQVRFGFFDILRDESVRQNLKKFSEWPTFPQLYINGEFQGGLDIIKESLEEDPDFLQHALQS